MLGFDLILKFDEGDPDSAEICVEGMVGERPYTFLLDTGAATTSLVWDEYTSQLPRHSRRQSSGLLGDIEDDWVTIHDLQVGSLVKKSAIVTRLSQDHPQAHSLIGMDLLHEFCCHFLFSQNRVVFAPAPAEGLNDLFLDDKFHPYVPVTFDGETTPTVWDTGASLTCVDAGFVARRPNAFEPAGQSGGTDASGNSAETPLYWMRGLACGGHVFPQHKVVGIDLSFVNSRIEHPMTMILGYSTLHRVNWVFDFPERKWGILPQI
ncbi:MAG: aspartyl protease family protein [Ardenticatenaceae bacterium]|nr:aspartyl protease family protein [Ardenticatenaceae bacterium]MCB9446501.1 aspartyl protease family protein [Ardenticatenaceae bacterium]